MLRVRTPIYILVGMTKQAYKYRFFPSSKCCSCCGFVHESQPLSIREWDCLQRDTHHDRDINVAKNITTAAGGVSLWSGGKIGCIGGVI
ncbi:zinc ribbon domain-containing protein [Candidatus Sororendozoicomonas aggregata]|uniref:zinc ribbon domain-containing protein n=1 Tax=Candidatus Sororendozoicomonas aggregata TaxID=3073239 RepID=UPI002ED284E1